MVMAGGASALEEDELEGKVEEELHEEKEESDEEKSKV